MNRGRLQVGLVVLAVSAAVGLPPVGAPVVAQTPALDGPPICGVEVGMGELMPDDQVLRVATFNILHTRGDYDDETLDLRIELLADALAADGADVIGMQEVVNSANHGLAAQRIAVGLGARVGGSWSWCFYQSNPHLPGEPDSGPGGVGGPGSQAFAEFARAGDAPWSEGVAIVARGAIGGRLAHRLVPRAIEAPVCQLEQTTNPLAVPTCALDTRQILWARVATACGDLDMFTSHLANDESSVTEQVRLLQMFDALAQIDAVATVDPVPDVYTGDFNTLEGGPVWQAAVEAGFVDAFRSASPAEGGFTSSQAIDEPGSTVTERIDYILARPGTTSIVAKDAEVIGDAPSPFSGSAGQTVVWPSDHYGVSVTLLDESSCARPASSVPTAGVPLPGGELAPATPPSTTATTGGGASGMQAMAALAAILGAAVTRRQLRRW